MLTAPMISCTGNMKKAATDQLMIHFAKLSKMSTGKKERDAPVIAIKNPGNISVICSRML